MAILAQRRRSGFTLVEVLIVIVIILLLVGISLAVGRRVVTGGKWRSTEATLNTLDAIITEYCANSGGKVPPFYTDAMGTSFPLVDGRILPTAVNDQPQPALALFLLMASRESATARRMIEGIDGQFITRTFVFAYGAGAAEGQIATAPQLIEAPVILDGWGRPIRFVHPAFHGGYGDYHTLNPATGLYSQQQTGRPALDVSPPTTALRTTVTAVQFSRSCQPAPQVDPGVNTRTGDADEGRCLANRPYVYSMGPDGDAGTRVDNVYLPSGKPQWPTETIGINNQ